MTAETKIWLRRFTVIGVGFLVTALVGGAALYGVIHSRPGLDYLARHIGRTLSDDSATVRLSGLRGAPLSSLTLEKMTIADAGGVYATLASARIVWRPSALFHRRLAIASLTVGRTTIHRLPAGQATAEPFSLSDLMPGLDIGIGKVAADEIVLEKPVLGTAQRLSAHGSLDVASNLSKAKVGLSLQPLDGGSGRAAMELDYAASPRRFAALVRIDEPKGGILAQLAGLPAGDRLFIDLAGAGPPDGWRGKLTIEAAESVSSTAAVSVSLGEAKASVALDGVATVGTLLPDALRGLAAGPATFRAAMTFDGLENLSVDRLDIENAGLKATGSGRFDAVKSGITGAIALRSKAAMTLDGLWPAASFGAMRLEARLDGTLAAPRAGATLQLERIEHPELTAAALAGRLTFETAEAGAVGVSGSAKISGIEPGGAFPGQALGGTVDATFAGIIAPDLTVPRMTITAAAGPARLALKGKLSAAGLSEGTYSARVESLAGLARPTGVAVDGRLNASGTFRSQAGRRVEVTTRGALDDLSGPSDDMAAALGSRIPFEGTATWDGDRDMSSVALKVAPDLASLSMDGHVTMKTGHLAGSYSVETPALDKLSALLGTRLRGRFSARGALKGTLSRPAARGQALFSELHVAGSPVGDIGVGYEIRQEGASLRSSLRIGGNVGGKKLTGALAVSLAGDILELSDIDVRLGENRVTGAAGYDRKRSVVTGAIAAAIAELADIPGSRQLGLAGSGTVKLTTTPSRPGDIEIVAETRNLRRPDGSAAVKSATARLKISSLTATPRLEGDIRAEGITAAGVQQGLARLKVSGDFAALRWSASARATLPLSATMSAEGDMAVTDSRITVTVGKLEGNLQNKAIASRLPFSLSLENRSWRVSPVDLSVAGGRIRLAGTVSAQRIDANSRIDGLPLRLASLIDRRFQVDGTLGGSIRITGAPGLPVVDGSLTATQVRPLELADTTLEGFEMSVAFRQDQRGSRADARLSGPAKTTAAVTVETGPMITVAAARAASVSDIPIKGEITASGRLGLIDRIVGLGEDRVDGDITVQARIAGTLGDPDIHGDLRLQGGTYEGVLTGTIVRNIESHIAFRGKSVELVSLRADDGGDGRLSGRGKLGLAAADISEGTLDIALNRFTALRRHAVELATSGRLRLSGPVQAPKITGRLKIVSGEIRIPDHLADNVVALDVVEINGPAVLTPDAKEKSLAETVAVGLDLEIEFPGKTFVRGRGLESEWRGKLAVSGTSRAPVLKGKLEAVRGTFAFAGKTFRVKSGQLFFPSSATAEPEIAAVAEANFKDLLARIEIGGTVSKPTIKVSSEPAMRQEDVLAHILFGRATGQLSPIQAAQLAQTAATLSGQMGTGIMDQVRQTLGVDVLNVETGDSDGRGASLKAGKYLTEEVFISVTQGTEPGTQKVGVEVQVLPNVTVESNVSGASDSNIGVNWKWDY